MFGVTTPEHVRFLEDQGFPPGDWPLPSDALLRGKLLSPECARIGAPWRVPDSEWVLGGDDHNAAVGIALRHAVESEMLPRINEWYDPSGMLRDLKDRPPGTFPGLVPRARAIGMALLDVGGAGERLTRTLDVLPTDDFVRQWIERRSVELSA